MSNMVVQTNTYALNAHRNMKMVGEAQGKASSRLSSGYKINSAADDAAGLAISEKMRAQIRGLDMASKNAQDGQALIQTAEGGMQEIDNMLQRVRELVDQAANDTNEHNSENTGDRQKIQDEIDQLIEEIDSMSERTEFNKKKVINGSFADFGTQAAVESAAGVAYSGVAVSMSAIASTYSNSYSAYTASANSYQTIVTEQTTKYQEYSELAIAATNSASASVFAASASTFLSAANSATTLQTSWATQATGAKGVYEMASEAVVENKMMASAKADVAAAMKKVTTKEPLYFQVGANANQGIKVNIGRIKSDILGIGNGNGVSKNIDVLKKTGADITGQLKIMDNALSYVTSERSKLGAIQNRLEYTMKSLDVSSENLSDAESRVRDADMAKEMMAFTKSNVLQQASVSMLTQANQLPNNLLSLLR